MTTKILVPVLQQDIEIGQCDIMGRCYICIKSNNPEDLNR